MVLILILSACSGGSGGQTTGANATPSSGKLSLGLTDAAATDYQAVYITIKEVLVSKSAGDETDEQSWLTVAEPNATFNLLELVNGIIQNLGLADLEAGRYEQIRLVLGDVPDGSVNIKDEIHPFANYLVYGELGGDEKDDYQYIELTIPSGFQSGFKIVGGFTIEENQTTDLVLDFNVIKSIVQAGKSGKWLLKPTVKVLDESEATSISGVVYAHTAAGDTPLAGAIVSAQIKATEDSTEMVNAATVTDETGAYTLLTEPGTYTVVAIMPGYKSASAEIVVTASGGGTHDFLLESAAGMGTIYGNVDIQNGEDEQSVRINILENKADGTVVEVASATVANGGSYWFDLPEGTYSMTAVFTVDGEEMTLEAKEAFEIQAGTAIQFDILFENADNEEDDDDSTDGNSKVAVCHKGRTITISASALKAHLNHGDVAGSCEGTDDDDGEDNEEPGLEPDDGNGQAMITICHKGRSITISESALNAHLGHGDAQGECRQNSDEDQDTEAGSADSQQKPGKGKK